MTSLNPTAIVNAVNAYRRKHHAPAVSWDPAVAKASQAWADRKQFRHSGNPSYGENLAMTWSAQPDMKQAIDMWYGEVRDFDFQHGGFGATTGHFTQLVWAATTRIGAGVSKMPDESLTNGVRAGSYVYVMNFAPPGNLYDANNAAYRKNVRPA